MQLFKNAKVIRVENAAAAGTSELVTDIIDTQGYEGVAFIALLGDVTDTSVLSLTGKTNSANSTSGATSLASPASFTAGATSADNKLLVLDISRPRQRYVFASLTRTTANAVVDGIIAVLYGPTMAPVTADASVVAQSVLSDPA